MIATDLESEEASPLDSELSLLLMLTDNDSKQI